MNKIGIESFDTLDAERQAIAIHIVESGLNFNHAFRRFWSEQGKKDNSASMFRYVTNWRNDAHLQSAVRDMVATKAKDTLSVNQRREEIGAAALEFVNDAIAELSKRGVEQLSVTHLTNLVKEALKQLSDKKDNDTALDAANSADGDKLDKILSDIVEKSPVRKREGVDRDTQEGQESDTREVEDTTPQDNEDSPVEEHTQSETTDEELLADALSIMDGEDNTPPPALKQEATPPKETTQCQTQTKPQSQRINLGI